jgi:SAM-dependent methyltransferase
VNPGVSSPEHRCAFCGSGDLRRTHAGLHHPTQRDHGPFQFWQCRRCGSGLTLPPPSARSLEDLYRSFPGGVQERVRRLRAEDPLVAWTDQCLARVARRSGRTPDDAFRWVEIGAGDGLFSRRMAEAFPRSTGLAVDWQHQPEALVGQDRVEWRSCDLNQLDFAAALPGADVVVSLAVWEHVLRPDLFAGNLARLLEAGGALYLLSPDYGSAARRLMGTRWPYFTPGEHLNLPTRKGARLCLEEVGGLPALRDARLFAAPLWVAYPLRYTLKYFGFGRLARAVPPLALPVPAGILEAGFTPRLRI